MDQHDRRIFDQQEEALGVGRDLKDMMRSRAEESDKILRRHFWEGEVARVTYQLIEGADGRSSEFVVANQKGRELDTLEAVYERKELPDGSVLETLEAQAGLEERRQELSEREIFFLKTVREAMRKAFEG